MSALQAWPDELSADVGASAGYRPRRDRRVTSPTLAVQIRGRQYQTLNWSLGGMLLAGYEGALVPGDTFEIDTVGRPGKTNYPVLIQARVVRVGGETGMEMAAQFLTVNAPAYDILEGILLRRAEYRESA